MKKNPNKLFRNIAAVAMFLCAPYAAAHSPEIHSDSLHFAKDTLKTKTEKTKVNLTDFDFGKYGKLKLSGYIQAQWQYAESKGASAFAQGGSFDAESNNRFAVRRGRIKLAYEIGFASLVIQPDFSEKGLKMRDVYIKLMTYDKVFGGQIGGFDRPFGYEISYSSSVRESPERSRIYSSLMPGEREVGALLKFSKWGLSLDAGVFNGNGLATDNDSYKDFIGRLAYSIKFKDTELGAEASYYRGSILNKSTNYFSFIEDEGFYSKSSNNEYNYKREYFGVGIHYNQKWWAGRTNIYSEYLWGTQPGSLYVNYNTVDGDDLSNPDNAIYVRKFRGGYVMLSHQIAQSKHSVVLKYDLYDPNTQVRGDEIGKLQNTTYADIAYTTYGIGYVFDWTSYLRLTAYYDIVCNETSESYIDYKTKRDENILTLRMQLKF
ncbi:MAG: hypothetical protein R3Y61_02600 [Rikenellaceae bacterium]